MKQKKMLKKTTRKNSFKYSCRKKATNFDGLGEIYSKKMKFTFRHHHASLKTLNHTLYNQHQPPSSASASSRK